MGHQRFRPLTVTLFFFCTLLGLTPETSRAGSITFTLLGDSTNCVANGLVSITGGCSKNIAGSYSGFTISDVNSMSNKARIEFVEGGTNLLQLTGAIVKKTSLSTAENLEIIVAHEFTQFPNGAAPATLNSNLILAGGFNLRSSLVPTRTVNASSSLARVCSPPGTCTGAFTAFSPSPVLSGSGATFVPFPTNLEVGSMTNAAGSTTLERINLLLTGLQFGEKISSLTASIYSGADVPGEGGGCTVPMGFEDSFMCKNLDGDPSGIAESLVTTASMQPVVIDPAENVPEPAAVVLLGSGLAALWGLRRRGQAAKSK
jgi:hypothetical protein